MSGEAGLGEAGSPGLGDSGGESLDFRTQRESCLRDLLHLESQFADLRHKLYQERSSQVLLLPALLDKGRGGKREGNGKVEKRLEELRAGRGWEYQKRVAELEAEARQRSTVSDTLRQFQVGSSPCGLQ